MLSPPLTRAAAAAAAASLVTAASSAAAASNGPSEEVALPRELVELKLREREIRSRWAANKAGQDAAWPKSRPAPSAIPALRSSLSACERAGGPRSKACEETKFELATALVYNTVDAREGMRLYRALADAGHREGTVALAAQLADDPESDAGERRRWLEKAAFEHGHEHAQYTMATCLYTGDGLDEDERAAFELFAKAAEQGHTGGLFMAGDCLFHGVGCEPDLARAVRWTYQAAEQGHHTARSRVLSLLAMS